MKFYWMKPNTILGSHLSAQKLKNFMLSQRIDALFLVYIYVPRGISHIHRPPKTLLRMRITHYTHEINL